MRELMKNLKLLLWPYWFIVFGVSLVIIVLCLTLPINW